MLYADKLEDRLTRFNISALKLIHTVRKQGKTADYEKLNNLSWDVKAELKKIGYTITELDQHLREQADYLVREHQVGRFPTGAYKTAPDSRCNRVLDVRIPREIDPETGEIIPAKGVYVHPETGAALPPGVGTPPPTDQEVIEAVEKLQREGIFKR